MFVESVQVLRICLGKFMLVRVRVVRREIGVLIQIARHKSVLFFGDVEVLGQVQQHCFRVYATNTYLISLWSAYFDSYSSASGQSERLRFHSRRELCADRCLLVSARYSTPWKVIWTLSKNIVDNRWLNTNKF
jgi:hypothetical protein